jgi:L-fuculose-phosphate aldolase
MELSQAKEKLLNCSNAYHDRHFRAYGQLMLRLDDNTYIMSKENLLLSCLNEGDINLYDINTGDIGTILRTRPDINAIAFICTEPAALFSENNEVMLPSLDDLAQMIGPDVRVAPTGGAQDVLNAISDRRGCFIKGTGIIAVGGDLEQAVAGSLILEKCAEAELYAPKLGGIKYIDPATAAKMNSFYDTTYTKVNQEGHVEFVNIGEKEFDMRNEIIEYGKKMCRDSLVQGTWGNISMRLSDTEMLVTPTGMDYFTIKTEDIVKVNIDTLEYGIQRKPTTEAKLHAGIYKKHPECNAVIHTHSNGCSVFAAARAGFRIENPELQAVIGDINSTRHEIPGTDEFTEAVLEQLENSRACIIANHGVIFAGNSMDVVYAIANAVESKACNLLGYGTMLTNENEPDEQE